MKTNYLLIIISFCLIVINANGQSKKYPNISNDSVEMFYNAIMNNNPQRVNEFIKKGFPLDITTQKYDTPFDIAIRYRSSDVVKVLIENGSRFDKGTVIDYALIFENDTETIKFLVEKGAELNPEPYGTFNNAAFNSKDYYDLSKYLLLKGANPDMGDIRGKIHFLFAAVDKGDYEALDALKLNDDEINVNDDYCHGETPLIIAIRNQNIKMIKYLLGRGADKKKKETFDCSDEIWYGDTPLQIAKGTKNQEIINLLK